MTPLQKKLKISSYCKNQLFISRYYETPSHSEPRHKTRFPRRTFAFRNLCGSRVDAQLLGTRSEGAVVLSGGGLTLLELGPVVALAGDPAPANLATGKTAFALDELGLATHFIANVTNGTYGNASSWIGNGATGSEGPFIGVNLGGSLTDVSQIAFGRSNVLGGDPCGVCTDRTLGVYTLQYTQVGAPDNSFVTTGDAATGWVTIGTLDYQDPLLTNVDQLHLRHLYSFDPVTATGVRLIVPASGLTGGTAIDEIEIYAVPEPSGIVLLGLGLAGFLLRRRR